MYFKMVTFFRLVMTVPFFMALSSCIICLGQKAPAQQFYKDTLLPVLKTQHIRNFTVKVHDSWFSDTGTTEPQLTCFRHYYVSDKYMAFETDRSMIGFNRNLYYNKESLRLIDMFEGFVIDGNKEEDSQLSIDGFQFCLDQMQNYQDVYYSFLLRSFIHTPYLWGFREKKDTVIDDQKFHILRGKKTTGYTMDTTTNERIPVVSHFEWFCNAERLEISHINVLIEPLNLVKSIDISDYSYDNKDNYVDSLFFHNSELSRFKHFNCRQSLPHSIIILSEGTMNVDDSIYNLPIVSLQGDTTTLQEQQGWVLLDIWTIRCKPCMDLPRTLQKEQQELGYRNMENAGIKIMYVNGTARATDKMREHVAQWNCEDITFSCEGLLSMLKENSVPQLYLISPDGQIVWHSNQFTSSEDIIDIKNNHIKKNNH